MQGDVIFQHRLDKTFFKILVLSTQPQITVLCAGGGAVILFFFLSGRVIEISY